MSERFRPDLKGSDRVYEDCWQCDRDANGKPTGSVSWGAPVSGSLTYANGRVKIIGKVCFKCNGTGRIGVLVSSVRAREGNARRAAAKAQAKAEAAAAEFAKWEAINADLIAEMKASGLEWLREAAVRGFGPSQIPQMREALDAEKAEAARQAAAESVPDTSERIKITGAILGFKSVPAFQPWQSDVLKDLRPGLPRQGRAGRVHGQGRAEPRRPAVRLLLPPDQGQGARRRGQRGQGDRARGRHGGNRDRRLVSATE
jgi:hypothetical protein